jgi:SAM-dependent methyltransferase
MDDYFPATVMPDRDWWSALWPEPEGVLSELGVPRDQPAVDLCCGDGYFTASLSKLACKVYALDLDGRLLNEAREYVAERGEVVRVVFIEDDARNLAQHISDPVNYVLLANTFHGVPDKTKLAIEVRNVLAPHGRFAIVNWNRRPREQTTVLGKPRGPATDLRMSPKQTTAIVEPAGFELGHVVELPPYHYGALFVS